MKSVVDPVWYLLRYSDVAEAGLDPIEHYLANGQAEGRFPNPEAEARQTAAASVNAAWYLLRYSDVAEAGLDPIEHYLANGQAEGRFPNPEAEARQTAAASVNAAWYLLRYSDVAEAGLDPIEHYLANGQAEGRFPNPEAEARQTAAASVNAAWYLLRYSDVAEAGLDPIEHYLANGQAEGRFPNPEAEARQTAAASVNAAWYLLRYSDVAEAGLDPIEHYLANGQAEGRFPNQEAEEHFYLADTTAEVLALQDKLRLSLNDRASRDRLHLLINRWRPIRVALIDQVIFEPLLDQRLSREAPVVKNLTMEVATSTEMRTTVVATGLDLFVKEKTSTSGRVVFDISDLVSHLRYQRLPTGIQRVQIEVVSRAFNICNHDVRVGTFVAGRNQFMEVPLNVFRKIAQNSNFAASLSDDEWDVEISRLYLYLITADPFVFHENDNLVNLGSSWGNPEYFLFVRTIKRKSRVKLTHFVHDLIPVMTPQYCHPNVVKDFRRWIGGALKHCDKFLVNSLSTEKDLKQVATHLGFELDKSMIDVVSLDGDYRGNIPTSPAAISADLAVLLEANFVLFVSTLEPRKNHLLVFRAWEKLAAERGNLNIPKLVCVGRRGWLSNSIFAYLSDRPALQKLIYVVEHVGDQDLVQLYRHCLFTIYPSHYEGWGLPITESLCFGKVPVVASNSSLVEAGGRFAVYFQSDSLQSLSDQIHNLLFAADYLRGQEDLILKEFRARSWEEITSQICDSIIGLTENAIGSWEPPAVELGVYYGVGSINDGELKSEISNLEVFRIGAGWHPISKNCVATAEEGGVLSFRVGAIKKPRLFLRILGLESTEIEFEIRVNGRRAIRGSLQANVVRGVLIDLLDVDKNPQIEIELIGSECEESNVRILGESRLVRSSIKLLGFMIYDASDRLTRVSILEAALCNKLGESDLAAQTADFKPSRLRGSARNREALNPA